MAARLPVRFRQLPLGQFLKMFEHLTCGPSLSLLREKLKPFFKNALALCIEPGGMHDGECPPTSSNCNLPSLQFPGAQLMLGSVSAPGQMRQKPVPQAAPGNVESWMCNQLLFPFRGKLRAGGFLLIRWLCVRGGDYNGRCLSFSCQF